MQSSEAYGNKANLKRFNITQFHISMSLLCEMSFDEQSQIGKDKNIYSTCNSIVTKKKPLSGYSRNKEIWKASIQATIFDLI